MTIRTHTPDGQERWATIERTVRERMGTGWGAASYATTVTEVLWIVHVMNDDAETTRKVCKTRKAAREWANDMELEVRAG